MYIFKKLFHTKNGDRMEMLYKVDVIGLFEVTLRCLISLIALFLITKLLGKKQVSQLSLFDYVIGISIGNFAAEISVSLDEPFLYGLLSILIFGLVAYLVSIVTMKSIKLRRFFIGVPTPIIQNGKLLEHSLKKEKLDINDLLEECRNEGYFDISEIEYALLEANGKLSILPKAEYKSPTVGDLKLKLQKQGLSVNVIIDGKIMEENLNNINKSKEWLLKELKVKGYAIQNILLATINVNDKLIIYERNLNEKIVNVLE